MIAGTAAGGQAVTGGQAVAATGTAYVGVTGAHTAPRLNQLQGLHGHAPKPQQLHPATAGIVATASMTRILVIVLCLLR
jgi:hypothetical protein